jgi:FHS family L-fucose permease-like MFS transporter
LVIFQSRFLQVGLMHHYGYKKGIFSWSLIIWIGCIVVLFPAAGSRDYAIFLAGLFVMAAGATFLETVANPYIYKNWGMKNQAAQRLNLAQSFNGVGAFIAPIIGDELFCQCIELQRMN